MRLDDRCKVLGRARGTNLLNYPGMYERYPEERPIHVGEAALTDARW